MRKALCSTAALVALLSGAMVTWGNPARAATSNVTMGSDAEKNAFKFFPAEISVPVGSTVQWENKSDIPHDAVAEGTFNSKRLQKGDKFEFTFTTPGTFNYICTESGHEGAGMTGVVNVTGGGTSGSTATTTTTAATTGTTSAPGQSTTTTTAKAAAGGSTTTTTAGGGATSTTQAPSVTPSSAPDGEVTTTTAAPSGNADEAAAGGHGSEEGSKKDDGKSSPLGIAFVAISTVLLAGISGKLLASKS